MKLINNWKEAYKFLTVQTNVLGIIIISVLIDLPSHLVASWSIIPQELKDSIPPEYLVYIALVWFIINIIARIISQYKLHIKEDKNG